MTSVSQKMIDASQRAQKRLAGRDTPFVTNCWYVAGFSWEFSRALRARTILGRPLVLYRTAADRPVALSDRCVHRSYPLSASTLDGDTIVCGYHGLRYDADGQCVEAPALQTCPRGVGVRSYPVREQGPLVWIWMGEAPADEALPIGDWVSDPAWPASQQSYHLPASYIALHENLLDLTHLSFLHANSFGTPDFASAPYEVDLESTPGRFVLTRSVMPTRLPPVWAEPTGLTGRDAARITTSEFLAPSAHVVSARFYGLDVPEQERADTRIMTAHLVTPETAASTHYFIHHARNFAQADPGVTQFMNDQLAVAFTEDVVGLTKVEQMIAATPDGDFYEISLNSDRAGLAMRRWLFQAAHGAAD
ncbi:ring-hydroxylating dioxygenase, large terminal subunit [Caulobacter sp. AP07]|uniref:aromatic ring-hydroxylating dioxygenase subunit alpha n=1 Tax=Caulobacter sp. AP07 TaxID=1144304 RepID=UPI0002720732|nr:aromatic ring-hydroxylating dioxygenase subunit alpha [Caulobacter sp. AP07]EJL27317.1 ring-hydroxylating dioxygenase, large terminal subunit [Caulobacter sp. AP07]